MINILNKYKSIPVTVKASIAYTVCNILQKSITFITLPIFTRLLTTEQYGQYSVYLSWQSILTIFITLNLPYGSFSKAMIKFEDNRNRYIASCEMICLILSLIFLIVYLPFLSVWNKLFGMPTYIILILVLEILAQNAILFWNGKKRFECKYNGVIAVTLFVAFLAPTITYFFVKFSKEKGYARILGYAVVNIAIGGAFYIYNFIKSGKLYDKEMVKYAIGFNLPLIIYYLSQVVFNESDRIMIDHYSGTDKAGIYSVAYSFSMILTVVLNSINNSYVPWFYEQLKHNKGEDNKNISFIISLIMAVLLMGVIWVAPEIIRIMAGEKYVEAIWIVPPVAMSNFLLIYIQFCVNIEFFYEQKILLVCASIASAIVNIVLNALLIPRYGFIAAGYTTLISYFLFLTCNYIAMKRIIKDNALADTMYDYRKLFLLFVVFFALSAAAIVLYDFVMIRFAIIVVTGIVMIIFRKKIMLLVKQLGNIKR